MFGNNGPQGEKVAHDCRPDPEETLQRQRARKEEFEKGIALLHELGELNIHIDRDQQEAIYIILGKLHAQVWDEEQNIARTLAEIDKQEK